MIASDYDSNCASLDWQMMEEEEETRQLLEMEESECSSSSDEEGVITESRHNTVIMPTLLQSRTLRLATIREDQDYYDTKTTTDGGSLSSAALTFILAYGLLLTLVMGFVATVVARGVNTAPGKVTAYMMRNKKDN